MDLIFALALAVALGAAVIIMIKNRRRWTGWRRERPLARCLRCRGTGWLNTEPERTLNVLGDGFEDRHTPSAVCPACGGTGLR